MAKQQRKYKTGIIWELLWKQSILESAAIRAESVAITTQSYATRLELLAEFRGIRKMMHGVEKELGGVAGKVGRSYVYQVGASALQYLEQEGFKKKCTLVQRLGTTGRESRGGLPHKDEGRNRNTRS